MYKVSPVREGYKRFSANLEKASGDITNEQHHYIVYICQFQQFMKFLGATTNCLEKNGPNR